MFCLELKNVLVDDSSGMLIVSSGVILFQKVLNELEHKDMLGLENPLVQTEDFDLQEF